MTLRLVLISLMLVASFASAASAISITTTTNGAALQAALGGAGMTLNSVVVSNGAPVQYGTYTGFTAGPVTIANGVVLSTGEVAQTTPEFNNGIQGTSSTPSTSTGMPGTPELDAYGPGHITAFSESSDVAVLTVTFTLAEPSQIGFDFIFGSIEYPQFTSDFTDAFVAFLDGTGTPNQIVFDGSGAAVQVGATFAAVLRTDDQNTAFANPHGLVKLTTFTTAELSAGVHTLAFQIGDVNDDILDSAVFIANLRAEAGQGGTNPTDPTTPTPVPEPSSLILIGVGIAGLCARAFRKN